MKHSLPPFHLLVAFEAVSRHLSFKKAANELCLSAPAISQKIRVLEEHMEGRLFIRESNGIYLTKLGEQLSDLSADVISRLTMGYQRLHQIQESPIIKLSTTSHIALNVLIPALPAFQKQHPDIDLRIETSDEIISFESEMAFGAVRIGLGNWPNLTSQKLCDLSAIPVASKGFMEKIGPITINTLQELTLIHSRTHEDDWQRASLEVGIDLSSNKHLYFNNYQSAIAAAENASGVALAMLPLSHSSIHSGSLVPISEHPVKIEEACYFVYPDSSKDNRYLTIIESWLHTLFSRLSI